MDQERDFERRFRNHIIKSRGARRLTRVLPVIFKKYVHAPTGWEEAFDRLCEWNDTKKEKELANAMNDLNFFNDMYKETAELHVMEVEQSFGPIYTGKGEGMVFPTFADMIPLMSSDDSDEEEPAPEVP